MKNSKIELQEIDIKNIAINHINKHPSTVFTLELIDIQKDSNTFPCWSVVFEMKNKEGAVVDGPLILGIDELGKIVYVG